MKALPQAIAGPAFQSGIMAGEVERRDARNNAERLAHGIGVDAGTGIVGELALEHVRRTEADFHHFEAALDVAPGIRNGLAVFTGEQLGQAVIFGFDQLNELAQNAHAALRIGRSPGWLCSLGVFNSRTHFFLGGQSNLALHRAIERLENVGRAATFARHMLAANKMSDITHRRTSLMSLPYPDSANSSLQGTEKRIRCAFL